MKGVPRQEGITNMECAHVNLKQEVQQGLSVLSCRAWTPGLCCGAQPSHLVQQLALQSNFSAERTELGSLASRPGVCILQLVKDSRSVWAEEEINLFRSQV